MVFSDISQKERMVLFASVFLLVAIFGYSFYYYYNPPIRVLEARVFDVEQREDTTLIWTYGQDRIVLKGVHDIELEEVYRITYRGRTPRYTDVLISIEKIS
jgi:hypothetical protein